MRRRSPTGAFRWDFAVSRLRAKAPSGRLPARQSGYVNALLRECFGWLSVGPALAGLSHHGPRTLLYTSRGTGFWGPPFRVFAPSEITLLVLRSPHMPTSP